MGQTNNFPEVRCKYRALQPRKAGHPKASPPPLSSARHKARSPFLQPAPAYPYPNPTTREHVVLCLSHQVPGSPTSKTFSCSPVSLMLAALGRPHPIAQFQCNLANHRF